MKKEVKQEILKDPRFAHVLKDPRFKPLRKEQVKVKVDKRFQSMFHDKKFQVKSKIDERGRPIPINSSDDIKRFYELSESDSDDDSDNDSEDEGEDNSESEKSSDEKKKKEKADGSDEDEEEEDEEEEGEDEDEDESGKSGNEKEDEEQKIKLTKDDEKYLTPEIKEKLQDLSIDYARGQDILYSDSSSGDDSSDEEDQELAHDWGELDKDAETTEEATSRLAVCNMNWDRAKAVDLMVLFHSFLPAGGLIHSVTVYPSEFGLKKMKEEEEQGPNELREIEGEDENGKISQEAIEKLRIYQLNRLKYYYAVVVCDSPDTANALYKACDGLEYECSSSKLDLRFVPEDMTFDQEPRETCTSLPDLTTYKPRLFQTKALTHSKAELTWDETDPDRQDIVKLAHSGDIKEDQLKRYLACSSSEGEGESEEENEKEAEAEKEKSDEENEDQQSEKGKLDKYKALLAEIEAKEKKANKNKVDLEVTWNLSLEKKASQMVKEKMKDKGALTPFQQFLEKRKEKRKKRKEEKKKKHEGEEPPESGDSAFSDDDIPSDIDMNDPYFKEEMEQYKKKKKKNKKKEVEEEEEEKEDVKTKKAQLELLMLDKDEHEGKHFNMKKIVENEQESKTKKKKKLKKKKDVKESKKPVDDFQVDVNDERFSAIYSSHHFNIDPADPNFKVTQGTKALIEEKLKRRAQDDPVPEESAPKIQKAADNGKKKNAELSVLVKTIKRKTSEAQSRLKR